MNVPRGFERHHGHVSHVNPLAAMFNPAWATETSHMVIGAYLATAFGVASVYAVGMLRGRRDAYHRRALAVGLATAAVIAPLQLGVGSRRDDGRRSSSSRDEAYLPRHSSIFASCNRASAAPGWRLRRLR